MFPNVEDDDGDPFSTSLAEDEVLKYLTHIRYRRSIKRIIFAVEFCFAFRASQLYMGCLFTHS
jgi:hypothetical protein